MAKVEEMRVLFDRTDGGFDNKREQKSVVFKAGGRYYLADWVDFVSDRGTSELMVFACNSKGEVRNWADLACWNYIGKDEMEERIAEFAASLDGEE